MSNPTFNKGHLPVMLMIVAALAAGCGDDSGVITGGQPLTMKEAWTEFENLKYEPALGAFTELAKVDSLEEEGRLGMAWCEACLYRYDTAAALFGELTTGTYAPDAHMGLAAVYLDKPDLEMAIKHADLLLTREPQYVFAHRATIDFRDAHLIAGTAAFRLGQVSRAVEEVNFLCALPGINLEPIPKNHDQAELEQVLMAKLDTLASRLRNS